MDTKQQPTPIFRNKHRKQMTKLEIIMAIREEIRDIGQEARHNMEDALHDDAKQFWNGKVFAALDMLDVIDRLGSEVQS